MCPSRMTHRSSFSAPAFLPPACPSSLFRLLFLMSYIPLCPSNYSKIPTIDVVRFTLIQSNICIVYTIYLYIHKFNHLCAMTPVPGHNILSMFWTSICRDMLHYIFLLMSCNDLQCGFTDLSLFGFALTIRWCMASQQLFRK